MEKIIIISPAYPLRGGIAESTELLYKECLLQGIDCQIISYKLQYPKILFPGKTQVIKNSKKESFNILSKLNSINPISWFLVAKFINSKNPDCVIFRYWNPFFSPCLGVISLLLKNKKIKKVGWVDNIFPHKKIPFQNMLNRFFLKQMHGLLIMSQSVKAHFQQYKLNTPVLYSPHPIYNNFGSILSQKKARSNLNINSNDKYILFFGFIRKYKGLDLIIESIADKRLRKKNIKLIIAGEFYEDKKIYLDKIDKLNLKESVLIYDHYIKNEDVQNYFCSSNLVVLPYLSATQSGVTMIAFHFNRPVLVTNVGGLSEYIKNGENGYVVNPDSQDIVNAILDYFDNNKEYSFSQGMLSQKNIYSWLSLLKSFEKLYKSI